MKKFLLVFLMFLSVSVFAQRQLTPITVNGVVTVSSQVMLDAKTITAVATTITGVTDSTSLTLYGSADKSHWVPVNFSQSGIGVVSPKSAITGADLNTAAVSNGSVITWYIEKAIFPYYKLEAKSTGELDNTSIAISWSKR